jgi:hypothetical protein
LQERDNYVTAERVRNVFLGAGTKTANAFGIARQTQSRTQTVDWREHLPLELWLFVRIRERLADFLRKWYNVSDIPIRDIGHKFICDFEAYLVANYQPAHNTPTKYLKNLRHIIEIAFQKNFISRNPFINFRMQYKNPDRGFLT